MRNIVKLLLATAILAAATSQGASAHAACSQWDLSGLQLKQTNGYIVGLGTQNGYYFNGRVNLSNYGAGWVRPYGGGYGQGWAYGSRFTMTIYWDNGSAGDYDARIYPDGWVSGMAFDRYNRNSKAAFWSVRNARCRY